MKQTQNINIESIVEVASPEQIQTEIPLTDKAVKVVTESREVVKNILNRKDNRLMVVVGPCSIHDPKSALEYAERLIKLADEVKDNLYIVMRVYFEKPRTTVGWKGLINDPKLDGTCDINNGIRIGRKVMSDIVNMGMPIATEFLDPISPQYLSDLITWAAIGARTTESQTHREMSSGLSMPVGYKNGTNGNLLAAINAMMSASEPHSFLGLNMKGGVSIVNTKGNLNQHVILRGGDVPNFDPVSVASTVDLMKENKVEPTIMVDCSHGNSLKRFELQEKVLESVVSQRNGGNDALIGVMIESHLNEGNQKISSDPDKLAYGVSITDACLGWDDTSRVMHTANDKLAKAIQAQE